VIRSTCTPARSALQHGHECDDGAEPHTLRDDEPTAGGEHDGRSDALEQPDQELEPPSHERLAQLQGHGLVRLGREAIGLTALAAEHLEEQRAGHRERLGQDARELGDAGLRLPFDLLAPVTDAAARHDEQR
jgi:hypothetical protein